MNHSSIQHISLNDLIGKIITEIRCEYYLDNECDLNIFQSYIKLEDNTIFSFPIYDDDIIYYLNENNKIYYTSKYNESDKIDVYSKIKLEGQKIDNFYFCYYKDEIDCDKKAFLKLANGNYCTEVDYRPEGIPVGLLIYDELEFQNLKREYSKNEDCEIKSYL